jgi:hypothetical protein
MLLLEYTPRIEEIRSAYKVLIRKPQGKRSHGIPKQKLDDNMNMHIAEIGFEDVDWIQMTQNVVFWWVLVKGVNFWVS